MVPDHHAAARLDLDLAACRGDDDPGDTALLVHQQIGERSELGAGPNCGLPAEGRESPSPQTVEVELPVEEHEGRLDGEPVLEDLAGGVRQEPVRIVPAAHFQADQPAEATVEQPVDGDAQPHVPDDDGPADQRAGPEERPHPAKGMPPGGPAETRQ